MWKWPQSRPETEEYLHVVSGTCHSSECYLEFAALGWNTSESLYNVFPKDHSRVAVLMSNIIADCIIKVIQNKCLRGILFMKISCYADCVSTACQYNVITVLVYQGDKCFQCLRKYFATIRKDYQLILVNIL